MIIDHKTIASVSALLLTIFFLNIALLTLEQLNDFVVSIINFYKVFFFLNVYFFGLTIIFSVINYFISFILLIIFIIVLCSGNFIIYNMPFCQ